MCVGGKGVTRGRQRLSLETADNEEMVEFPSSRFQTSLASVCVLHLLIPPKNIPELNSVLLTLYLVLKEGPSTLLTPVNTTSPPASSPK